MAYVGMIFRWILKGFFFSLIVPASTVPLFPPDDCLPMSDQTYDDYRHKGMKKEFVETFSPRYSRILYCYYGCCGDGTNNGIQCCLKKEEESGLGTLKIVSIVAAGVVGLLLVIISLVHYVKANNKKKRMIADIQSLQRSGKSKKKNKKAKRIKVGEYQRDEMNKGNPLQNQWHKAPQGNIFMTKQTLPSIPAQPKTHPAPDPSEFTEIVPKAGEYEAPNGQLSSHKPVPPPAEYYNPDQEVLKSIIASLPGPKGLSVSDNTSKFYGRY